MEVRIGFEKHGDDIAYFFFVLVSVGEKGELPRLIIFPMHE